VRHISPQLCAQVSCISLSLLFASTSYGQKALVPVRVPQRLPSRESLAVRTDSRLAERDLEREKRILLVSLREDFRQLQIINLELMKRTFLPPSNNAQTITSKEIRASLGEIQSLARRLKMNFRLPEVKTDKSASAIVSPDGTLSSGLLNMDRTVMRFVENPIFDAELSVRAAEDLEKILRLTDSLRKLAKEIKGGDRNLRLYQNSIAPGRIGPAPK
jgi:hypothetical protein